MFSQPKVCLTALILCGLLSLAAAQLNATSTNQTITEILEDQRIELNLTEGQTAHYKYIYALDPEDPEIYDLSIDVTPLDGLSDPDVFVSRNTPVPDNDLSSADYIGASLGYDIIVVPKANISINDTFYITVYCSSELCSLRLNVQRTDSYWMSAGSSVELYYRETAEEVIEVYIPPATSDKPIDRIIISASLLNSYMIDEPFHMYADKADKPPGSSDHALSADNAWFDGKAIVIYDDDANFCTNCTFTILIQAQQDSLIKVSVDTYGHTINMLLGQSKRDAVDFDENITYVVNLTAFGDLENDTIIIQFTSFEGRATLRAHPNALPADNATFYWVSPNRDNQEIIITAPQRNEAGLKDLLYIIVAGIRPTTYELKVYSTSQGASQLTLGTAAVGFVVKDEIVNYLLPIFTKEPQDIKIVMTEVLGNTDVYIKSCQNKTDCELTQSEIDDYEAGKKNASSVDPIFLATDTVSGQETISFTHVPGHCDPDTFWDWLFDTAYHCYYAVALVNSGSTMLSRYSLNAFVAESIVQIPEGLSMRGHVDLNEDDYYSFTVTQDLQNTSIVIQVTEISGEVDVYASRTERYPSNSIYDWESNFFNAIVITPADAKNNTLKGTYYVNVHGTEASTYTIVVYYQKISSPTTQKNNTGSTNTTSAANTTNTTDADDFRSVQLNEGVPQYFVVANGSSILLSFSVSFVYAVNREVDIVLQPMSGKLTMYATNGNYTPSSSHYQYKSDTNKLIIKKDSEYFVDSGTYMVRVYCNGTANNDLCGFKAAFVTSDKFLALLPRDTYHDYLNANSTMYFRLEIADESDSVSIVVTGDLGQTQLFVSLDSDNPFPSAQASDVQTAPGIGKVTLNKQLINKACNNSNLSSETGTEDHRCFVFVAVKAIEDSFYTITYYAKGDYLEIPEGVPTSLPLGDVNGTTHLYFIPTQSVFPTEILFSSELFNLKVYASIIDRRVKRTVKEWTWPTNQNNTYSSSSAFDALRSSKIDIPAQEILKYKDKGVIQCAVVLTIVNVGFISNQTANSTQNPDNYVFTVIASSEVTPLEVGKMSLSYVGARQYKYFQIRVLKPKCVLLIILTPLTDGDPDLYLSYGADVRPAKELSNYEFFSSSFKGEQLEITNEDIKPRTSMEGIWTIGVYGYANCSFTITVLYEDEKVIPVVEGVPADFEIEAGATKFFRWYNFFNFEFSIIISEEEGHVITRVNPLAEGQNFLEQLPRTNGTWTADSLTTGKATLKISADKDGKDFCFQCSYLIGITARTFSRGFLVISYPGGSIYLQDGRSLRYSVDKGSYERFQYFNWDEFPRIDINMIIYSGNPEIYVSTDENVSKDNFKWSVVPHQGEKLINLRIEGPGTSGTNSSNLDNFSTYDFPDLNVYYIAVYGLETSSYLIMATLVNAEVLLNEGVLTYGFISPGEYQTYLFYCSGDYPISNQRLKFYINVYNDRFTQYENLTNDQITQAPKVEITFDNQKQGRDQLQLDVSPLRNQTTYGDFLGMVRSQNILQVKEMEGVYYLNLSNPFNHSLNFSIIANRMDIFTIPLGTSMMSKVGVGEIEMYELFVNQSGKLAIKAVSCIGSVRFAAATTLERLENRDYDLEVRLPDGDFVSFGTLNVTPGTVYVAVQGIEGVVDDTKDPTREALYKFEAALIPNNSEASNSYFKPGNNGTLAVHINGNTSADNRTQRVAFEWEPVQFTKGDSSDANDYSNFIVEYSLVITKDPVFTQSYGLCSYLPVDFSEATGRDSFLYEVSKDMKDAVDGKFNHTIELANNEVYYVTVSALVRGKQNGIQTWEVPIVYQIKEINLTGRKETDKNFLMGLVLVCGLGFIGILIGVGWFVCKYQRVKRELKYEVMESDTVEGGGPDQSRETPQQA